MRFNFVIKILDIKTVRRYNRAAGGDGEDAIHYDMARLPSGSHLGQ